MLLEFWVAFLRLIRRRETHFQCCCKSFLMLLLITFDVAENSLPWHVGGLGVAREHFTQ